MSIRWVAAFLLLLVPRVVVAQCVGGVGVPFNCAALPTPQMTDLLFGGSQSQLALGNGKGAGSFTVQQLLSIDHSISPVTGNGVTNTLGTWMGYLAGASNPNQVNFGGGIKVSGSVITFPGSGSLVGTTDTQTLTNKTLTSPILSSPTLSGTVAGSPLFSGVPNFSSSIAVSGTTQSFPTSGLLVGVTDTQTLTNKTLSGGTISGTIAGAPSFSGIPNFLASVAIAGVTQSFPASGLLVGTTDTQSLTNKTLSSPTLSGTIAGTPSFSGLPNFLSSIAIAGTTQSFPASGALVGTSDTQTLTNKTLTGGSLTAANVTGNSITNTLGTWMGYLAGISNPNPVATSTYRIPGCKGDGVTNDTACVQAALTAGGLINLGPYTYLINSALASSAIVDIEGNAGNVDIYSTSCPSGVSTFVTTSNINLLTLTGLSETVRGVCFQMGTAAYQRTAGAALTVGGTLTTQNGHDVIEHNSFKYPYDGIIIGGATTGATQTNITLVSDNQILEPTNRGIANGPLSSGASTNDTDITGNAVACFQTTSTPPSIGFAIYDGGIRNFSDNEAFACNTGTAIIPGTANGAGQTIGGAFFYGILGDSSVTNDLLINTTTSLGLNYYLQFANCWASNALSGRSVLIEDTAASGGTHGVSFTGCAFHGSVTGGSAPLIDVENDVYNIVFTGNKIRADGGATTQTGMLINSSGSGGTADITVTGNSFISEFGNLATGISITGTGDLFTITGNIFPDLNGAEIVWPSGTSSLMRGSIANNNPMASLRPTITAAATINLMDFATIQLTGATGISNIQGGYTSRQVFVVPVSGPVTLSTGGAAGQTMCAAYTTTNNAPFNLFFDPAGLCWWAK